jgi:hypothetical protein
VNSLESQLAVSVKAEQVLRRRLSLLEETASQLRELRSPLLDDHATAMAECRAKLNWQCRQSTLLRERIRKEAR